MTTYNQNLFIGVQLRLSEGDQMINCHLKDSELITPINASNIKIYDCYFENSMLNIASPNNIIIENVTFIQTELKYKPFLRLVESKCHTS